MTKKVLFVCMGNICRSPAGEAVMQRFAEEFDVNVDVDSAGTHGYHVGGKSVDGHQIGGGRHGDIIERLVRAEPVVQVVEPL